MPSDSTAHMDKPPAGEQSHQVQARVISGNHVCHCGKRFLRKEHLRRHAATHEAPSFTCPECHRSFTRNDMLQRHAALHGRDDGPSRRSQRACEACRANKTKCDGGARCSLCVRKGIVCTYKGSMAEEAGGEVDEDDIPAVQARSHGSSSTTKSPSRSLQGVPDRPSPAATGAPAPRVEMQQGQAQTPVSTAAAVAGMRLVFAAIETRPTSLDSLLESTSPDVRAWFEDCRNAYLEHVHIHWPVIHMVTFDFETDPLDRCLPVVVIGCLLRGGEETKELVVEAHQRLADGYFDDMIRREALPDPDKAWPFEKYQGTLLTIIFTLYSNSEQLTTRALLLLRLCITEMRRIGMFSAERAEYQKKTHFPGDFVPYVMAVRQVWSRLAAYFFKVDAYMSLLTGQHPTMAPHELDVGLPVSCSAYDANLITEILARLPQEPSSRDGLKLHDVLEDPWLLTTDSLLVEDITRGLCEPVTRLWGYRSLAARREGAAAAHRGGSRVELLGRLAAWKERLDDISYLCESSAAAALRGGGRREEEPATDFPLRAYRSGSGSGSGAAAALARARPLVREAAVLHHLLGLHVHADVRGLLGPLVAGLRGEGDHGQAARRHAGDGEAEAETRLLPRAREWARSADGRTAVGLAVTVLEEAVAVRKAGQVLLPLADAALAVGSVVVRAWIEYGPEAVCGCRAQAGLRDLEMLDLGDAVAGREKAGLARVSLCRCNVQEWEGRFRVARQQVWPRPVVQASVRDNLL